MTSIETLRITLPRAIDLGNDQIASRQFDLRIFVNSSMAFRAVDVGPIWYAPTHISLLAVLYRGGVDIGQYGGSLGTIPITDRVEVDHPTELILYNFSTDSEAILTVRLTGYTVNEFSGR